MDFIRLIKPKYTLMKKILVPTDFSDHARNAGYYAVNLARQMNASLALYHAYNVKISCKPPVYSYQFPLESMVNEESVWLEKQNQEKLRFFKETILRGRREPNCSIVQQRAFVNDGISSYAEELEADLIVMGTRSNNQRSDMLIATTTWGVIKKSKVPVLAVPDGYTYNKIENICFATNLSESDASLIKSLARIARIFDAQLTVVHVADRSGDGDEQKIFDHFSRFIARHADYDKLDFKLLVHSDVSEAISNYLKNNKTDIIALTHEKRNIVEQLFHRSYTRKLALHSEIPILAFTS